MTLPNGNTVEVESVPFYGGDVLAAQIDGKTHIVLRPAIERLGLDYSSQLRKLKSKSWACVVNLTMQLPGDTQTREHAAADIRTFLMLMATVNEKQVADSVRKVLVAFQGEIADVIEAYFTEGVVENPRLAPTPAPVVELTATSNAVIERAQVARAHLAVLEAAKSIGVLDTEWIATKTYVAVARGLSEEPEIPFELHPIYVPDFLASKGMTKKEITSKQSWFGRRVADLAKERGIEVPKPRFADLVSGQVRNTVAWKQKHLRLFEDVWSLYYAAEFDRPLVLELGAA